MSGTELSLTPLLAWASAFALLLALGTNVWGLIGSSSRNNGRRIDEVSKRADAAEARLASVEQTLRGMPGPSDIHSVQLALSEMRGDLRAISVAMTASSDVMKRLETIVTRHEEHLLGGAKR